MVGGMEVCTSQEEDADVEQKQREPGGGTSGESSEAGFGPWASFIVVPCCILTPASVCSTQRLESPLH